jgi:haloacetate dehalogenase
MSAHLTGLEGFAARRVDVGDAEIFVRTAGSGPPLLLLHGYPQTHLCWARVAPALSQRFSVVLADLTGYGDSRGPAVLEDGSNYAKRAVARHMTAMMQSLGHPRFRLAGHARGARVAYRLALDHPGRVERLAVLSILPTFAMWRRLADVEKAIDTYHWFLLAQKPPIPHDLLGGAAAQHVRSTIASWTKSQTLGAFTQEELDTYAAALSRPEVIAGVCGDYRAGWTTDRAHDAADLADHRRIASPVLLLWGVHEYSESDMLAAWREIAADITAHPIDSGHFVTEEAPQETLAALLDFF